MEILVDGQDCCGDTSACPFFGTEYSDCSITDRVIDSYSKRPEWCPLLSGSVTVRLKGKEAEGGYLFIGEESVKFYNEIKDELIKK